MRRRRPPVGGADGGSVDGHGRERETGGNVEEVDAGGDEGEAESVDDGGKEGAVVGGDSGGEVESGGVTGERILENAERREKTKESKCCKEDKSTRERKETKNRG